ncbi:MAG: formate/nitrite transporter family protein [Litorimonas sp.]
MMSLEDTLRHFSDMAEKKRNALMHNPIGFFIAAMMAGAYVGVGIMLILAVGEHADPSLRTLIMGVSFGIALTLVVFAGAELFTGHTMYMSFGVLSKKSSLKDLSYVWVIVWIGNLIGCMVLALLANLGTVDIVSSNDGILFKLADKKTSLTSTEMVARGILCNWLVCLALWTSARTDDDTAKLFLIFWCLFAFIACGFEHSVANMTVFTLALFSQHPDTISVIGAGKNLFWVTIGNTISGVLFLAMAYWKAGQNAASTIKDQLITDESKD